MPPFRKPSLVTLRRQDLSQPWGFRLIGGVNHGQPFVVQKVTPDSIAFKSGLQEGDEIVRIGNITLRGLTHEEVQEIILRCSSTIDLFVIRINEESSQNQTKDIVNRQIPISSLPGTESAYYTNSIDYKSPTSPLLKQYYETEQETYQRSDYHSPPLSKRPVSPLQKPPISGRPFSPPMNRPFSPTNQSSSAISYHDAEEQQWLSTPLQDQQRDTRVFGSSPRPPSSSPSPVPDHQRRNEQQRDGRVFASSPRRSVSPDNRVFGANPRRSASPDNRVFGARPLRSPSPSFSPVPDYQKVNEQQRNTVHWSPSYEEEKDTRVFGAKPRTPLYPSNLNEQFEQLYADVVQKTPALRNQSNQNAVNYPFENQQNQRSIDSQHKPRDNRVFAENKKAENYKNPGYERPQVGRVINDRRIFGSPNKNRMQKFGGSFDEVRHWKEPLPQMKSAPTDQLLPSQTKQQQTYIVQTPPTEKMSRPPLTGSMRRRIRPVWPPPDFNGRLISKGGFNPGGRDSPSKKYMWPPMSQSFDDEYYDENGMMSPNYMGSPNRFKYSTPPPGALQQAWNPRSGSVTPPGVRAYRASQRVKNTAWPPPSNATPAGRSGFRPQSSLPGSRRSSQVDDYLIYGASNRIPGTYRPPPGTQYFQQSFHYDTD